MMGYSLPDQNRRILLLRRPEGIPVREDFIADVTSVPVPDEGQLLLRNLYLSVDPAQRGWAQAATNYAEPVPLGTPMRALAVAIVIESRNNQYSAGDHLYGFFNWQDYCIADPDQVISRVDPGRAPISTGAGLFGINGLTAYIALTQLGQPRSGDTLLVSTAAGAVGSIVGQVGRLLGCRTIGVTGSDEKVSKCRERFGYDDAFNYRKPNLAERIACLGGIDVFFDNTGGAILDAAIRQMGHGGRIIQSGTASVASWSPPPHGPRNEREVLLRELTWRGFVIFNHRDKFDAAADQLGLWLSEGRLAYDEDITDDFTQLPNAIAELYAGRNHGKRLVYVGG